MTNQELREALDEAEAKGRGLYDTERDELGAWLRSGTVSAEESAHIRAVFPNEYAFVTAPENRMPRSQIAEHSSSSFRNSLYAVIAVIAIVMFAAFYGKSSNTGTAPQHNVLPASDAAAATNDRAADDRQQQASEAHAKRDVARTWYMHIVNNMAIATAGAQYATANFSEDNSVDMSSILKKSGEAADTAANYALNPPDGVDGWSDISQELNSASSSLRDSIEGIRKGIDNGEASTLADAKDELESATSTYQKGVHDARIEYESMGGKWSDLPDGEEMRKTITTLLNSASQ